MSKKVLAVAAREIGYHEGAGKHNKYGEWFGMDNVAWCMEFVQWVYDQAGMPLPYKTPSCGALLRWYQKNDPECITKDPIPGSIVIFDFAGTGSTTDHTGLFVSRTQLKVTSIDGNTSAINQANGGWVQEKTRSITYANPTYIRPRGLVEMTGREIIDSLTNEEAYELLLMANEHAASLATPEWMKPELDAAVAAGITDGSRPLATCMRGQAAMMVLRAMNDVKKSAGLPYEEVEKK